MERRKLLIGSGVALATAIAGCSDSETSSDDTDDSTDSTDDSGTDDYEDDHEGDDHEEDDYEEDDHADVDIPGFDHSELELDSDLVDIETIEHDGRTVHIDVTATIDDEDELGTELSTLADDLSESTVDLDRFESRIRTIEWTISLTDEDDISFYVETKWIVKYVNDELSAEKFLEYVLDTLE